MSPKDNAAKSVCNATRAKADRSHQSHSHNGRSRESRAAHGVRLERSSARHLGPDIPIECIAVLGEN